MFRWWNEYDVNSDWLKMSWWSFPVESSCFVIYPFRNIWRFRTRKMFGCFVTDTVLYPKSSLLYRTRKCFVGCFVPENKLAVSYPRIYWLFRTRKKRAVLYLTIYWLFSYRYQMGDTRNTLGPKMIRCSVQMMDWYFEQMVSLFDICVLSGIITLYLKYAMEYFLGAMSEIEKKIRNWDHVW